MGMEKCELRDYVNYEAMTAANKDYRRVGVVWCWHDKPKEEREISF